MRSPTKVSYVTQKDVARLANVSQAAVAAALGGTNKVRVGEETRRKILKAAERLNYSPNQSASVVRTGRTKQIAVIVQGTMLQTVFHRLKALANVLADEGFRVVPHELDWTKSTLEEAWNEALAARAEGIVLSSSFGRMSAEMHKKLLTSPVPVVSLCGPGVPGIPLIAPDLRKAFRELTGQLLKSGRRRLVLLGRFREKDPIEQIEWKRAERTDGFWEAVREYGAEKTCGLLRVRREDHESPMNEHGLGMKGFHQLLAEGRQNLPDVIVCTNDNFAQGVLAAAHRSRVKIPEHIQVTGCDGEEWAAFGAMPITTIVQPARELALKAAEVLIGKLGNSPAVTDTTLLPCEIVWRESCLRQA